jgi:hypothetical protein
VTELPPRQYLIDQLQAARADRDHYRARLDTAHQDFLRLKDEFAIMVRRDRIDGDVLGDVITNACPPILTSDAARDIAEAAITELWHTGATVFRGTHHEPWSPDCDNHTTTDVCNTVEATTDGDVWLEYAVMVGAECVATCDTQPDAEQLAEHVTGAWVSCRRVTTGPWVPVIDTTG